MRIAISILIMVSPILLSLNAAAANDDSCEWIVARGLDYSSGNPSPIAVYTNNGEEIHVARGEREAIILLAPSTEPRTREGHTVSVDAGPLQVAIYQLSPVPGAANTSYYDALVPIGTASHGPYLADFGIPRTADTGPYRIRFRFGACFATAVLQVHAATLPTGDHLIVQAAIDPSDASSHIVATALDYGINSFAGVFPRLTTSGTELPGGYAVLQQIKQFLKNPMVRYFRVPVSQYRRGRSYAEQFGIPASVEAFKRLLEAELQPYRGLLDDDAFRKKLIVKLWDEPVPENYPEVATMYSAARAILPDVRLELAEQPEATLTNAADIWTIHIDYLVEDHVADRHAAGHSVLLYANKMQAVQNSSDSMRRVGWILWRYGLDGYHFWRLNWWNKDPWTTRSSWTTDFDKTGTFVYPAPDDQVYPSVRLLSFREGLEDARLLRMAEHCLDNPASRAWLDSIRPLGIADPEPNDTEPLYDVRAQLLATLDAC